MAALAVLRRLPAALASLVARLDAPLYALWAAAVTLSSARSFYGYMLKQTGGEWSAPLDDVFIHFDYARATALGHPFEWVVGNGYSSGNTSLSYPFVLAAGYRAGFRDQELMVWAAIVACCSVFLTCLLARKLVLATASESPVTARLAAFLVPPALVFVGALAWSLWSGMEVALFLATWSIAAAAWLELERAVAVRDPRIIRRASWLLGASGAAMVLTRPEATLTIATFGLAAALAYRRAGARACAELLARVGAPAALVVIVQALANRAFTGEWSANGAIVKLAANNPFMTTADKLADYTFNLRYAVFRNIEYHFADRAGFGLALVGLAALPLAFPATRRVATVLWLQMLGWLVLVAANGQVRWQNERYTMPAVAWLMLLAVLGVRALLPRRTRVVASGAAIASLVVAEVVANLVRAHGVEPAFSLVAAASSLVATPLVVLSLARFPVRVVAALALLSVAITRQAPKHREQRWFFGRASRNIRDQQVRLGRFLAEQKPRRVLVGDAGAILYASNRPGLDIIGLGGFHALPFARAGLHGLPASLELIERMAPSDRPDVLAIFPTWWGVLPTWFSSGVIARFPVEGNVICGGYEHVVYKADWHAFDGGSAPFALPPGDHEVTFELDVADLVSERAARYAFDRPGNGWTDMRVLPHPKDEAREIFDGGRRIGGGRSERFVAPSPGARGGHLVLRTAPEHDSTISVRINGVALPPLHVERADRWVELAVPIPGELSGANELSVEITPEGPSDFVDFHAWITR